MYYHTIPPLLAVETYTLAQTKTSTRHITAVYMVRPRAVRKRESCRGSNVTMHSGAQRIQTARGVGGMPDFGNTYHTYLSPAREHLVKKLVEDNKVSRVH